MSYNKVIMTNGTEKTIKCHKIRDLNYFEIDGHLLVFACDSSGAVGCLDGDESYRDPKTCGTMYPKCVLMELLACGAELLAVYNDFCYAEDAQNDMIIQSIEEVVEKLGYDRSIVKNSFGIVSDPHSTAYGVTAVALIRNDALRTGSSVSGDIVCAYSVPSWRMDLETQTSVFDVRKLAQQDFIHEILPCGSHGFRREATDLARGIGLSFQEYEDHLLYAQGKESCGASAVVLVTLDRDDLDKLIALQIPRQLTVIGELTGTKEKVNRLTGKHSDILLEGNGDIVFDGHRISSRYACEYGRGNMEADIKERPGIVCERLADECLADITDDGKIPLLLVNDLNFAMDPGGRECIEVLKGKTGAVGLSEEQLTGSTEDNHVAIQSGYMMRSFFLTNEKQEGTD